MEQNGNFVSIKRLKKYFPLRSGFIDTLLGHEQLYVHAVDDISFDIKQGENLGLVGESGSGKTTTGRTILRLTDATSGEILFKGKNIPDLEKEEMRELRKEMQIVFQDPFASLNPRWTVRAIIREPLIVHGVGSRQEQLKRVNELLQLCGMSPTDALKFPHQFSGGQRQRIAFARSLALNPEFIVADEPVSALDVSIRAQILNLMKDLQDQFGLTYLMIAHDLSVIRHMCQRVAVMYAGHIMELAEAEDIYKKPAHPYTEALTGAIPLPDPKHKRRRVVLKGEVPNLVFPPSGCRFHPRCTYAQPICSEQEPPATRLSPTHTIKCFFPLGYKEFHWEKSKVRDE
jgi:oligopeptide/dipeptide ABC transporter ATP-binding protein